MMSDVSIVNVSKMSQKAITQQTMRAGSLLTIHLLDTFARVVGSLFPQCSVLART